MRVIEGHEEGWNFRGALSMRRNQGKKGVARPESRIGLPPSKHNLIESNHYVM